MAHRMARFAARKRGLETPGGSGCQRLGQMQGQPVGGDFHRMGQQQPRVAGGIGDTRRRQPHHRGAQGRLRRAHASSSARRSA